MKKNKLWRIVCTMCLFATLHTTAKAEVVAYNSNHTTNKLHASDYYKVEVIQGGTTYQTMEYMSKSNAENNSRSQTILNNTISWANFSFSGKVKIRVTLLDGQNKVSYSSCNVFPTRDNISVTKINNKTAEFELTEAGQYSVEFGADGYKNGLMIFANPLETMVAPSGSKTKVFTAATTSSIKNLGSYNAVYFKDGLHDIGKWNLPTNIKKVYIEGGAVVQGAIYMNNSNNDNTTVYGRGMLDGRKLFDQFSNKGPNGIYSGDKFHGIESSTSVSNTTVDGIITSQAGAFFVRLLGTENVINNVKTIAGWINNNDGLVGYQNTDITNCFVWACDDGIKLYRDNQYVDNVVMWHLTNGGCFQWCWTTVDTKNVRVSNIDVIRGQWTTDGDNQGVFNVRGDKLKDGPKVQTDWVFDDIRVDNEVKILFNVTPEVNHTISNVTFKNIDAKIDGSVDNRITGPNSNYKIKNITIENLKINGTCINDNNKFTTGKFKLTNTSNVSFACGVEPPVEECVFNVASTSTGATCDNGGSVSLSLSDYGTRSNVKYKIGNGSYSANQATNSTYTVSNITPGTYDVYAQWGDGSCIDTKVATVTVNDDCEPVELCTINVSAIATDAPCNGNGTISLSVTDFGTRSGIKYKIGSGNYSTNQSTSNTYTVSDVIPGTYDVFAQWGNGDCFDTKVATVTVATAGCTPENITDLTATAEDCQTIALTWSDTEGETSYRIRRKQPNGSYIIVTDVNANSTSFIDNTVDENSTYIYQVRPMVNGAAVKVSNNPQVTTPACPVQELTDISDLTATVVSCSSVKLNWTDVGGEDAYRVRRKLSTESAYTNLTDVPANTTTYTDNTTQQGKTYIYMVRPVVGGSAVKISNTPTVSLVGCNAKLGTTLLFNQNVKLYPNPVQNQLTVEGLEEGAEISIYTTTGEMVLSTNQSIINTSDLLQGIYFLKSGSTVIRFMK